MATTCDTIFSLPSPEAGIATPRGEAMLRSPVTVELAAGDHRDHPRRREVELDQRDQRGEDEELVGKGVEDLPQPGDLAAAAGQVAVEPVGERREAEDGPGHQLDGQSHHEPALELREQHRHQQRHQEDARDRDAIGQVHGGTGPFYPSLV